MRRWGWAIALALAALGTLALVLMPRDRVSVPESEGLVRTLGVRAYHEASFPDSGTPRLERPVSIALGSGRVYVADSVAGVIRVFDERGRERSTIGSGTLEVPAYVAVSPSNGVVFVTDRRARSLYAFRDDGSLIGTITPHEPRREQEGRPAERSVVSTWAPLGLAVDEEGALYVTDVAARHRVLVLTEDGTIVREIGGPEAALAPGGVGVSLDFPNGVRVSAGEVWVTDSNNQRIVIFTRDGRFVRVISRLGLVRGLDVWRASKNGATFVFVADPLGGRVAVCDEEGEEVGSFGLPGTTVGRLAYPNDVAVARDGRSVYVADTGNRRIQVWGLEPVAGEGSHVDAGRLFDVRERVPYVAVAVASFASALLLAVAWVSLRRRDVPAASSSEDARGNSDS